MTFGRADARWRLPLATSSRILEPQRGNVTHTAALGIRTLVRLNGQHFRIEVFSSLPKSKHYGCELAGEGDSGQGLIHPPLDHAVIEVLERAWLPAGRRRRALEDLLDRGIVVPIESARQRLALPPHRSALDESELRLVWVTTASPE